MGKNQMWRDSESRLDVAERLSQTLVSRSRMFHNGVMGAYVGLPDFSWPFFSGTMREMNGALRAGLRFMAGEEREDAPLSALYDKLADGDRALLGFAFADAVDFYGFRPRLVRWRHLESLGAYFGALAVRKGDVSAAEGHQPELLLHHALIRFMADLFDMDDDDVASRPLFLSEAVDVAAGIAWEEAQASLPSASDDEDVAAFYAAMHERGGVFKAAIAARGASLDIGNDWGDVALRYVLGYMTALIESDCRIGPAVNYALSAYGARHSDCDAIAGVQLEEMANGWSLAWTPGGKRLGSVAERHDGLWFAGGIVADSRDSAVGILIEERTGMMSVRGEDGARRDLRVYAADEYYSPWEGRFSCEIWEEDHGLSGMGAIEFALRGRRGNGTLDGRYRGVVEEAQGRRVSIRDIVSADGNG